jgi:glyoxylase-like metal-dependent hydrolase (beta-lactamase superfamily II)
MTVRLYGMTCGWLSGSRALVLPGTDGTLRVPVPSFLVVHPKGTALFDTGLHVATQSDPAGRLGWLAKVFQVHFARGEEIARRLEALEMDAARVDFLVNSHLHFDHAGGNVQIPNARWVIQRREWEAARDPELAAASGFDASDWDHGHERLLVDGEHDLFGDGSVVCLPTFGHTPGHQSLRVALDSGPVILTGDACYLRETLEKMALPAVIHDREAMRASLLRLRSWRDTGARLFYGHDPEQWSDAPASPFAIA